MSMLMGSYVYWYTSLRTERNLQSSYEGLQFAHELIVHSRPSDRGDF
ncbi:hypothetical protein [Cohnella lupini]|uniref:Uncharacterized protein n=1 Tax=Cohnella lupini TaxID=1294267 RepID=A0A3D9HUK7_9BACL|nr:hypothetical protein [Cohnella lupini]RED53182.1 hypothetical protein DFP95_12645 [Cohnella lupini]